MNYVHVESRGRMKTTRTLFLAPLTVGMAVAVIGLDRIGDEGLSSWQWCLAFVAVLLAGLLAGALLNFAVFAPVYWLLGRLYSRRSQTKRYARRKA